MNGTTGRIVINGVEQTLGSNPNSGGHTIQSITSTGQGKFKFNFIGRNAYGNDYQVRTSYADFMIFDKALMDQEINLLDINATLAILNGQ